MPIIVDMFPAQHVLSSRMHRAMQCIVAWLQQVLQFIGLGGSQSSNATLSAATSLSCQQKHQVLLTELLLQRKCCSGKNERAHLSKSIRHEMRYRRRAKENARFQEAIEFSLHAFIASSGSTRPVCNRLLVMHTLVSKISRQRGGKSSNRDHEALFFRGSLHLEEVCRWFLGLR